MGAEPAFGADHLDDDDYSLILELARELGSVDDPRAVRKSTAVRLGQHLHVARAVFAHFSRTEGIEIDSEFHDRTVPRLTGFHRVDTLTTDTIDELWAGRVVAIDDIDRAAAPALYPRAIRSTQTRSIVIVPLRHRQELVAVFAMTRTRPHTWTRRELALASILAERAWFASQYERATTVVDELEARNRRLVEHAQEGYWERVVAAARLQALANFRTLITGAPYAVLVQQEGKIAFANPAACKLLGYPDASTIVGKSYTEMIQPEDQPKVAERIRRSRAGLPNPSIELRWRGKDGLEVWVEVASLPIDYDGRPATIVMGHDVTARRDAEQRLVASVHEKEVLLREIHHRVKNNLQVVSSMLSMQAGLTSDQAAREQLEESQARIHSIGLVHEHLYRSKDLSRLDLRNYIRSLVGSLAIALDAEHRSVDVKTHVEDLRLDVDKAISCGLIVSELVTNAFKHAFVGRHAGHIDATLIREGDEVVVRVSDDGVGLPPGFESRPTTTLGFELVRAFAEQLHARLSILRGQGTTFELRFAAS